MHPSALPASRPGSAAPPAVSVATSTNRQGAAVRQRAEVPPRTDSLLRQGLPAEDAAGQESRRRSAIQPRRWPDAVMDRVLRHLGPSALRPGGQSSRSGSRAAYDNRVQRMHFYHSYPLWYRQRLAGIDSRLAHRLLTLWCQRLPAGSRQRDALEQQLAQARSAPALFFWQTQQMLRAPRLSCDRLPCISSHGARLYGALVYSPDGTHLVQATDPPQDTPAALALWQQDREGLRGTTLCRLNSPDQGFIEGAVTFSADSQRLLAVLNTGEIQTWLRQADGNWQACAPVILSDDTVCAACFSPDGRCLVVQTAIHLFVFDEAVQGAWRPCQTLQWRTDAEAGDESGRESDLIAVMHFSDDSGHLLCIDGDGENAFVFDREGSGWTLQQLVNDEQAGLYELGGTLAPDGDWLALVRMPPDGARAGRFPGWRCRLELWCAGDRRCWHLASHHPCTTTGIGCPARFSPDGQQLAFADRLDNGQPGVSVLTRAPGASWHPATRLALGAAPGRPLLPSRRSYPLMYSAHSGYLAAITQSGVQLWRCDSGSWLPVAVLDNPHEETDLVFQFAPDGYHCVLATGPGGDLSLHGPGSGGDYVTKMRSVQGKTVEQLLFAPGGLLLQVLCRSGELSAPSLHSLRLEPGTWAEQHR